MSTNSGNMSAWMYVTANRLGQLGEKLAARHLEKQGFTIRDTNFRCPYGEIDIVAEKDNCLVFFEVRARSGSGFGTPEESVTETKKQHLIATAQTYLQQHADAPPNWRIDVVAVEIDHRGKLQRLEIIENAISEG